MSFYHKGCEPDVLVAPGLLQEKVLEPIAEKVGVVKSVVAEVRWGWWLRGLLERVFYKKG